VRLANPECPTCGETTCAGDIRNQCFCGRIDTCKNCLDIPTGSSSAAKDDNGQLEETTLEKFTCEGCGFQERMCEDCSDKMPTCGSCHRSVCEDCVEADHCEDCKRSVCAICAKDDEVTCAGCGGLLDKAAEDAAGKMQAYADMGDDYWDDGYW
jgi:hypothetical protein